MATTLIVMFLVWLVIKVISSSTSASASISTNFDRLVAKGVPARGILLEVSPTPVTVGEKTGEETQRTVPRLVQQRQVTIDVEIAGELPYVVSAAVFIPMNLVRDV